MAWTAAGMRGWQRWIARSAGGFALPLLSCLVTDHPEYGEPNVPAHLVRGPPQDFDRARPNMQLCSGTGTTATEVAFQADVSDANIDDSLEARIFVNNVWISDHNVPIAKTGVAERAKLVMCADLKYFDGKCNLVEIRVSRKFAINSAVQPEEPGDVSSVRWWIFDQSDEEPDVSPTDCSDQDQPDGGPPS